MTRRSWCVIIFFFQVFHVTSCGQSNFSGGGPGKNGANSDLFKAGKGDGKGNGGGSEVLDIEYDADNDGDGFPDSEPLNDVDGNRRGVQTFPLKTETRKIDMVWIIDNSDSMTDEAGEVRANFADFMADVSSQTDIQIALISASRAGSFGNTGVTLPVSSRPKDTHVDVRVSSTNVLAMAAAATCAVDKSTLTSKSGLGGAPPKQKICGQDMDLTEQRPIAGGGIGVPITIPYNLVSGLENPDDVQEARGKLSSFFRPDAIGMYVVVTDDDALGVTAKNFSAMVAPALGGADPKLFSFQGVESTEPDCDITRTGDSYERLAKSSGGDVFDICRSDWKPQFDKLTEKVVAIAKGQFALKEKKVVRISSVTIDGSKLAKSDYQLEGNQVVIKDRILEKYGEAEVRVVFYYDND